MIIWGGAADAPTYLNIVNTGGNYNPATDSWITVSTDNAPPGRIVPTAVWTGSEMIVWGGADSGLYDANNLNTGGRYNPATNTWTATSVNNAPLPRAAHTAVWTGDEMIIWGGGAKVSPYWLNTGGRYDPVTDLWSSTSTTGNVPTGRNAHVAVWTGSEMIVWGGNDGFGYSNSGGRYCGQSGPPPVRLANISTRAFVQIGDNVMIGGLIVTGSGLKKVILRAIGPSLSNFGIANALQDPVLELHDSTGALIASNDNWIDASNKQAIIDSGLAPSNNLDCSRREQWHRCRVG